MGARTLGWSFESSRKSITARVIYISNHFYSAKTKSTLLTDAHKPGPSFIHNPYGTSTYTTRIIQRRKHRTRAEQGERGKSKENQKAKNFNT